MSVFAVAASKKSPGRSHPRTIHGTSAPVSSAPANWNRLRIRKEGAARTWSCFIPPRSQRPQVEAWTKRPAAPHALQVGERAARRHKSGQLLLGKLAIGVVRDGADHQIV